MSREIPQAIRAAVGLAATVLDDARRLPRTLFTLPVRMVGLAMQATLKLQQQYSGLVARGDEVFTGLRGEAEPGLATFDDDLPEPTPRRTSAFDRTRDLDQPTSFDRASVAVDHAESPDVAEVDDELSGLPAQPAPEEVVAALADITDAVAAAGLDDTRPGRSTGDALETALLEADGAPDAALVDGGAADAAAVGTDEIAESPSTPPPSLLEAEATEFDVHPSAPASAPGDSPGGEQAGAPEVDVLTPDGGVATVEGTVTDEGIAAPEGSGPDGAAAGGAGSATGGSATDAGGTPVAAATGVRTDVDESTTGDGGADVVTTDRARTAMAAATGVDAGVTASGQGPTDVAAGTGVRIDVADTDDAADTAGAQAAGAAPVEGYDGFTLAQLRGRLRGYQRSTVQDLLGYEEATRAREPYLRMLRNRLEKLEREGNPDASPAPRRA